MNLRTRQMIYAIMFLGLLYLNIYTITGYIMIIVTCLDIIAFGYFFRHSLKPDPSLINMNYHEVIKNNTDKTINMN